MKKTVTILGAVVLVLFSGTFLVAFSTKKIRQMRASELTTSARVNSREGAQENNIVFYETVGSSPKSTPPSSAKHITRFTIEIANFDNQSDAEALLLQLKNKGIDGFYTPVRRGGQVWYRVRLGMFANQDDATKILAKVNSAAKVKAVVSRLQ